MHQFLSFCETFSGAIQAIATLILIAITGYYARLTHQSLKIARDQLRAALVPQLSMEFDRRCAFIEKSEILFSSGLILGNGGSYAFTIVSAEARLYTDEASTEPAAIAPILPLRGRVVAAQSTANGKISILCKHLQEEALGKWKLGVVLKVEDSLRSAVYGYVFDNVDGLRRIPSERLSIWSRIKQVAWWVTRAGRNLL